MDFRISPDSNKKNSLPGNTGFLQKLSYQADPNFDVVRILFRSDPNFSGADPTFCICNFLRFLNFYWHSAFTDSQPLQTLSFYRLSAFTDSQPSRTLSFYRLSAFTDSQLLCSQQFWVLASEPFNGHISVKNK